MRSGNYISKVRVPIISNISDLLNPSPLLKADNYYDSMFSSFRLHYMNVLLTVPNLFRNCEQNIQQTS